MKKNRLFLAFLALGICIGIAGCGNNTDVSSPVSMEESKVSAETEETDTDGTENETVSGEDMENTEELLKEETAGETEVVKETEETTETTDTTEPEIEITYIDGVPSLRDCVQKKLGGFVGCAATQSELEDDEVWKIITDHFSAITLGNELKPDALFNYSVTYCPGTTTAVLNGETITVPVLNYSRAEAMLDKIYDWNQENPDRQIKVRGHVLVWHSQTPEWFFHVDYDKSKAYVDKDTMNKRLEWYIKTVLEHFTGEDSKYKDMFYGWDVVNEAISDATGTYRSDKENSSESLNEDRHSSNSSWWHVYNSNEFIINAFKYANKYAPEDLELYYNDYNECSMTKRNGILELLNAIKAEEGEPGVGTRISAMGMQGHYGMESPSSNDVNASIKLYAKAVGKVQFTELDISASSDYDGSADKKDAEYEKLRKRYLMLYLDICGANKEDYVDVEGITFWGTTDKYSWLQSRSTIGGGNTTGLPQCPLLFDENYQPKSCFYVFANDK